MTLLNPAALAFLALVPLIVVLYLLKLRRQPARVSTLMFWQRVAADNRRRALFQRLRQILSLLLHLLIFGLLLFALARPEMRAFRGTEAGLSTVVVLDARARMQARAGGGGETRFDQARRIAGGYLRRASPRQPVALLVAESAPRVLVGLTGEERSLLDGLDGVRPTDAGGRIEDAVDLARGLLAARAGRTPRRRRDGSRPRQRRRVAGGGSPTHPRRGRGSARERRHHAPDRPRPAQQPRDGRGARGGGELRRAAAGGQRGTLLRGPALRRETLRSRPRRASGGRVPRAGRPHADRQPARVADGPSRPAPGDRRRLRARRRRLRGHPPAPARARVAGDQRQLVPGKPAQGRRPPPVRAARARGVPARAGRRVRRRDPG